MEYAIIGALIVSGIILLGIGIYVVLEGRRGRNLWFSGFSFAAAMHSFGYAFELTANTVEEAFVCMQIEYLGISFLPTFGILAALELTGNNRRLHGRAAASMFVFSFITLILVHTNNLHNLYYADLSLTKIGIMTIVQVTPGIWYKVFMAYVNLAFGAGTLIVANSIIKAPADLKPQYWIYLVSFLVPGVGNLIYLAGLSPYNLDLVPYGLMIMSVLLAFGLNENQLFQVVSLARSRVFDSMDDIVVIMNKNNRVIDHNNSLNQVLSGQPRDHVGEHLSTVFDSHPQIVGFVMNHTDDHANIALEDDSGQVFRTSIHTVRDRRERVLAKYLTMSNITNEMRVLQTMKDLANLDTLTDTANRRSFYAQAQELLRLCGSGLFISLIMVDIDRFKAVNDTYGHDAGDMVLREIALLLKQSVRAEDTVARYGGEEFVIIIPDAGADVAVGLAERLREKIADAEMVYEDQRIHVTASLGVAAEVCSPDFDIERLVKKADTALYRAKNAGRNKVVLYSPDAQ
ncbi:MAG: diguanylate cyclase [Firmicutes bacterium]|nr:diguanylate cyclase [Bacillota bacterium]